MKRVLLLVCLIVSLVQLDWERGRVYLLSSISFLLLIGWSELVRRRKVHLFGGRKRAPQDIAPGVSCLLSTTKQGDQCT